MSKSRDIADSAATINYIDDLTSAVQSQIDSKDSFPSQTGNSGKFLTTNGSAASWDAVDVSSEITGTLPVANGGTGAATLTANNVLLGNGTSAPLAVAPSTSGNVLTSNGTTWQSTAPADSGAWTLITTLNPSAASTIDFEGFTSDYDVYKLIFSLEFSGYDTLTCRVKAQGSYQTSSYAYNVTTQNTNSTTILVSQSNNTNKMSLTTVTSNNTMPLRGAITLWSVNDIEYQMITAETNRDAGTEWVVEKMVGAYKGQRRVMQGFRIMQDGSQTLTGVVQVYGLNK